MKDLSFRQIHLDFHTSGLLKDIGSGFSKENFKKALKEGHVSSITLFSKCHHGYSYHPTNVNEMHPELSFDLLRAQLEACKEMNVNAPVYISAGLDEKEAVRHPEWLFRNKDESTSWASGFYGEPSFHLLCYNTGYMDLLVKQLEEVMELFDPSGIFLDISMIRVCYCSKCRNDMLGLGLNPLDPKDAEAFAEKVYEDYCKKTEAAVRKYSKTATIFHNGGHVIKGRRDMASFNTHLELESLPTGGWGYDHFPLSAAYARTLGMDFLGMTGKFHTSWGEFGGFKHPNALLYETSLSIANGAKCSIGDQLHPLGEMNLSTYKLIGKAYAELERKESWCKNAQNVADIAVLSVESYNARYGTKYPNAIDTGINRILLEGHYLYNFIDEDEKFEKYKLLILPDCIRLTDTLLKKVDSFLKKGGKLFASGESGLNKTEDQFKIDLGIDYVGLSQTKPSYFIPEFPMVNGTTEYIMYTQGYIVKENGAEILGFAEDSYFNRSTFAFCSHQHTPNDPATKRPAVFTYKNTAYAAFNLFEDYAVKGELHIKELAVTLIDYLLADEKTIVAELPDRGVVTVTEQTKEQRTIVHLLFAYTTKRGADIEVIEDVLPLHNVKVTLKKDSAPSSVTLVPENKAIPFDYSKGKLSFTVPEVLIHQMICIN